METPRFLLWNIHIVTLLLAAMATQGCTADEQDDVGIEQQGIPSNEAPATPVSEHATLSAAHANMDNEALLRATSQQLVEYLSDIPLDHLDEFGFDNTDDLNAATLGAPYEMYSLSPEGQISALGYWRIPVRIDDEFRAVVSVKLAPDGYRIFEMGAAELATELDALEAASNPTTIVRRCLLRSYKKEADFVAFNTDLLDRKAGADITFHPLKSAKTAMATVRVSTPSRFIGPGSPATVRLALDDVIAFAAQ